MRSSEDMLAQIEHALHRIANNGDKIVAAIDHLTAAVQALPVIIQGVLDHEKAMADVISNLQAAAANVPADQSAAIEAAAAAIDSSVNTLKGTIPAPAPAAPAAPVPGRHASASRRRSLPLW